MPRPLHAVGGPRCRVLVGRGWGCGAHCQGRWFLVAWQLLPICGGEYCGERAFPFGDLSHLQRRLQRKSFPNRGRGSSVGSREAGPPTTPDIFCGLTVCPFTGPAGHWDGAACLLDGAIPSNQSLSRCVTSEWSCGEHDRRNARKSLAQLTMLGMLKNRP